MKKHYLLLILCFLFNSYLGTDLYAQCSTGSGASILNTITCPPCSTLDPTTCECIPNSTLNECVPFSCDDGDPCTSGDVEYRNCDGTICEPCAGVSTVIVSIEVINMRDCDDKGNNNPDDDTFKGDILVTFDYPRVIEDFIITGDAYFSYRESYCIVNENTITIENRTFKANGDRITLHGILNDRLSCSFTKNGLAGQALGPCNSNMPNMPNMMPGSDKVSANFNASQQTKQLDLAPISYFPNPAASELFIGLSAYVGKTGHMIISNHLGQIMDEISYGELPSDLIRVDLSRYTSGLYFVQTKVDGGKYVTKKILVSK